MARTTAKQVLDRVDALLPNGYARAEKLRWLAQAEGFVRRELCRETGELPVLTEETELTAAPPFDELYRHYVEAQVHYANGETARYWVRKPAVRRPKVSSCITPKYPSPRLEALRESVL